MYPESSKLNQTSIWKDINFLIWILPIAAYLMAIISDIGYLSYFGIPIFFAELNFYSAAVSAFIVFLLLLAGTCSLLSVAELEEGKHWIFPTLFNTPLALTAIIIAICFYFEGDLPISSAFWGYVFFNAARVYSIFNERASDLPFSTRIRNSTFFQPRPSDLRKSNIKMKASSLLDFLFTSFFLFFLALTAGNSIANHNYWRIEGHENTIVITRNNNLYIEKKFNPKTRVLEKANKLIFANEEKISIVPAEPGLRLYKQSQHNF